MAPDADPLPHATEARVTSSRPERDQELLADCAELMSQGRYTLVALAVCQAFESFMSAALRFDIVYRPHLRLAEPDPQAVEARLSALFRKTKAMSFDNLRWAFIAHFATATTPSTWSEADAAIHALNPNLKRPPARDIQAMLALAPPDRSGVLGRLVDVQVHELRSRAAHHDTYRPTRDEAEAALEEARSLIARLALVLSDSVARP